MRNGIKKLAVIGALVLMLVALPAAAQGRPGGPPPGPDGENGPGPGGGPPDPVLGGAGIALRELDLEPDQQEQVREIIHGYMEGELGTAARSLRESMQALNALTWDAEATEQEILDAHQALQSEVERLLLARHQLALEVLPVLTEEQRASLKQMLLEPPREPGAGGPGGRGRPGGSGRSPGRRLG